MDLKTAELLVNYYAIAASILGVFIVTSAASLLGVGHFRYGTWDFDALYYGGVLLFGLAHLCFSWCVWKHHSSTRAAGITVAVCYLLVWAGLLYGISTFSMTRSAELPSHYVLSNVLEYLPLFIPFILITLFALYLFAINAEVKGLFSEKKQMFHVTRVK